MLGEEALGPTDDGFRESDRMIWEWLAWAWAVALTFDDGPDPRYTLPVLETLGGFSVRTTFFLVGRKAQRCPGGQAR